MNARDRNKGDRYARDPDIRDRIVREIRDAPALVHCSSVVCADDGGAVAVWYEGRYETARNTVIRAARVPGSSPGTGSSPEQWGEAWTAMALPDVPLGNPILWTEDDGSLRMVFVALLSESWTDGILLSAVSRDRGTTWSAPQLLLAQRGYMPKTRPVRNDEGSLLLPLYHEAMYAPFVAVVPDLDRPGDLVLVGETMARGKAIQPGIVRTGEHEFLMLTRSSQGRIWKSVSRNDGYTWSICRPTALANPDSGIEVIGLSTGELLLVWNNSPTDRSTLSAALSADGGESWYCLREIARGSGEYSYPSAAEGTEGTIHITCTEDRFRIRELRLSPDWLREGKLDVPIVTDESDRDV